MIASTLVGATGDATPSWFPALLDQMPILAVCLLVAWLIAWYLGRLHRQELSNLREQHSRHSEDLKGTYGQIIAAKDAEIARYVKRIAALERRMQRRPEKPPEGQP